MLIVLERFVREDLTVILKLWCRGRLLSKILRVLKATVCIIRRVSLCLIDYLELRRGVLTLERVLLLKRLLTD